MLLTKEVEIRANPRIIKYYEDLGYDIPKKAANEESRKRNNRDFVYDLSKTFVVKIEDLSTNSYQYVDVVCDKCGEEAKVRYVCYNKTVSIFGEYLCRKCAKKHSMEKCVNFMQENYNVDNCSHLSWIIEKRKATNKLKYGVEHALQSDEFKEKAKETNLKHWGYEYASQSPEVKQQTKETNLRKYNVEWTLQNKEIKEKAKQTCVQIYGYENPFQSPDIKEKIRQTLYKKGITPTSTQQIYIYNLYNYNNDAELNYPCKFYNLDICFLEEKLAVEIDFSGHNLKVKLGGITQEEFDKKQMYRDIFLKKEGYKIMHIVSSKDYLPSDEILLQMLKYTRKYFSEYPNHSWVQFNVDTSTVRNAEQKEGSFFDYGELRKIKKSDLEECA